MHTLFHRLYISLIILVALTWSTTALAQDADGDGISDTDEMTIHMSNPSLIDTDGDGLTDGEEILTFSTNPTLRDSDGGGIEDAVELMLGTDPTVMGDDDPMATPKGNGLMSVWVRGGTPVTSLALAMNLSATVDIFESRAFTINSPLNFSNQPLPGPHGPFADHETIQRVWGADQNNFAVVFSGLIYVPPADVANPNNIYTFAVSSDEGFALEVFDGATTQRAEFDGPRAIATGPLLSVDFPAVGGLYPITLLGYDGDSDATSGISLSWAPGQQAAFDTNTFSPVNAEQGIAPVLESTQTLEDLNAGSVEIGDFLKMTVTVTNTGKRAAYDVRFRPDILVGARFDGYVDTPSTSSVISQGGRPTVQMPVLNQGDTATLSYTIIVEQNNIVSQGQWQAQVTPGQGLIRIVTDAPTTTNTADTGNRPRDIFADGATDDDANGASVGQDLIPPTMIIEQPVNMATVSNNAPLFYGTTEANATITLTIDANAPLTLTADVTGFWSYASPTLAPGAHTATAVAADGANNTSPTATTTFTISAVPFNVEPLTPVPGSHINTAQPTYTGITIPNAQVTIETYDDMGTLITSGNATANIAGEFNFTSPFTLNEGLQRVVITSTLGAQTATLVYPFTVDVFPPVVTFTLPSDMQTIAQSTPTLYGTTDPYAVVTISIDMGADIIVRANGQGQWQLTSPMMLTDGIHRARAQAEDLAGNIGLFRTLVFSIDSTPPTLNITFPVQDQTINNGTVNIRGTTEPNATVRLSIDGAPDVTVQANAMGIWSYQVNPALGDGPHSVEAQATDAVGNTSPTVMRDFSIDTSLPTIDITAPTSNAVTGPRPMIRGTAEIGSTVELRIDNGLRFEITLDATGNWNHQPTSNLSHGAHRVRAFATDDAGNTVNDTVDFLVDARAPDLVITSPMQGDTLADKTPTVTGTSDANTTITIMVNGSIVGTTMSDANGNWSFDIPEANALSTGENTIEASAEDMFGNKSSDQVKVNLDVGAGVIITSPVDNETVRPTFTVTGTGMAESEVEIFLDGQKIGTAMTDSNGDWSFDITDALKEGQYTITAKQDGLEDSISVTVKKPGAVTITSPMDGSGVVDDTPTIEGTALPNTEVTICINGEEVGTTVADANGDWTFTVPDDKALNEGENTIDAKSIDTFGDAISADPVTINYTTSDWMITITSPEENAEVDQRPTITGVAVPGATVDVFIDGEKIGTTTADNDGKWSFTVEDPIEEGMHTISVTGTDGTLVRESGDRAITVRASSDDAQYLIQGGPAACQQTPGAPPSGGWLLMAALLGMVGLSRRVRQDSV